MQECMIFQGVIPPGTNLKSDPSVHKPCLKSIANWCGKTELVQTLVVCFLEYPESKNKCLQVNKKNEKRKYSEQEKSSGKEKRAKKQWKRIFSLPLL